MNTRSWFIHFVALGKESGLCVSVTTVVESLKVHKV